MSQRHVECLERAKKAIQSGKYDFVCVALGKSDEELQIKRHIKKLLEHCYTLDEWVQKKMNLDEEPDSECEEMRALRLRWIDYLITEWKDAP